LTQFSLEIEFLTVYLWIIRSHFTQNIFSIMISSQYFFVKWFNWKKSEFIIKSSMITK
jgi:hypothetical protein